MGVCLCCQKENEKPTKNKMGPSNFIKKINKDRFLISFLETPNIYNNNKDSRNPIYEDRKIENKGKLIHDHSDQQGVPSSSLKEVDDWKIIENTLSKIRVKQITIFASYYICALEVVYIDGSGKETTSIHCADSSYKSKNLVKKTLDIEPDDYIEYINCAYSSQKTFIRLIRIATHKRKLLVHEGEIELSDKEVERDTEGKQRKNKYVSKSAICTDAKGDGETKIKMMCQKNMKSEIEKSEEDEDEEVSMKKQSLVDFYLKTQACNFRKLNLKVIGFKTHFDKYIQDIEVYAEPIEEDDLEKETQDPDFELTN